MDSVQVRVFAGGVGGVLDGIVAAVFCAAYATFILAMVYCVQILSDRIRSTI